MRSSGSKTGHWPRWPRSMAAHHRPRNWPPPAALSGCPPIRPQHDRRPDLRRHRVGWLRPRHGVCAGGRQAGLPEISRAAEVRGWLRAATRRAEPLRAAAAVGAYARDPMLGAIPQRHTPAGRRRRGDGATRRHARSAVCRVAARLAADLVVHRRAALAPVPAGVQLGVPGRTAAGGRRQRAHGPRHHTTAPTCTLTTPFGAPLMLTPDVAYMVIPSGGNSWSSRSRPAPGTMPPDVIVNGRRRFSCRVASPGSKSQPPAAARRAPDPHGDCPVWNMPSVLTRPELQDNAGDRSHFDEPRFSRDRMRAAGLVGVQRDLADGANSWMYASPRPHPSRGRGCPGDRQRRQDHDLGVGEI